MALYGLLGVLAWAWLAGPLRLALWVFLAGLALKTWIAAFRRE
jgi:hypothetical protein